MDNTKIHSKTMDQGNHKKIGILTYHNADNYGAVLQALALVMVLKGQGHDAEIIDYTTVGHIKAYNFFNFNGTLKSILNIILGLPNYFRLKRRHNKFASFRTSNLPMTRRYVDKKDFLDNLPDVDVIITGSDQVFNVWENKELSVYYLPFFHTKIKKIAYAPSFGRSEFTPSIDEKMRGALSDFDALSCREKMGAQHIEELTGKDCSLVVDPVLLLNSEAWGKMCTQQTVYNEPYILIYDLLGGPYLVNLVKQLNKGKNYKIVCITTKKFLKRPYFVDKMIWDASPLEFVGWFKDASYVVTDSFHGSAFATVFKKPLVSLVINEKASERLYTLLSYVESKEKILTRKKLSEKIDVNKYVIDFSNDYRLETAIELSHKYIKDAVEKI